MAPTMLTVITIVAAASPIRTIFEVVFWILSDGGLSTINTIKSISIIKDL
jgi:hypothetical protein